jgi:hypothetical protein
MSPVSRRPAWSVLMLVVGRGNDLLRNNVAKCVQDLGFEFHVYDAEGYPVDSSVHSHEACIRAIHSHDIVLAFVDNSEGGTFQVDKATADLRNQLTAMGVLPAPASHRPVPTVTQAEILTARSLGKPTLVFVSQEVATRVDQTLTSIEQEMLALEPRSPASRDLKTLIDSRQWDELFEDYKVPTGRIASGRHLLFIERLRKETPNYVTLFDPRYFDDVCKMIQSRLAGIPLILVRQHAEAAERQIDRARGPLTPHSLHDLLRMQLILEPPYKVESGDPAAAALFDVKGEEPKAISTALLHDKDVLLLGDPGHGKSTAALLSFRELSAATRSGVEGQAPLFASLRGVPFSRDRDTLNGESFIRLVLSLPAERAPWPKRLPLPRERWILVLDGADESSLDGSTLKTLLEGLRGTARVLLTCRETVFERQFGTSKRLFDVIITLQPWGAAHIDQYIAALGAANMNYAAQVISAQRHNAVLAEFISIPLWLSMLSYLAERSATTGRTSAPFRPGGQYELLRTCSAAVAEDEAERHSLSLDVSDELQRTWRTIAWLLLNARRNGRVLQLSQVLASASLAPDSAMERAALSVLDFIGDEVVGFFHEVFFDYSLAEYIVDRLADTTTKREEIADLFSLHRSYVTNKLVRQRIEGREDRAAVAGRLRDAYDATGHLGSRQAFARNQIIYLAARIDTSETTRRFVRSIWHSREPAFVRYAAAFSAAILDDTVVEEEYFKLLKQDDTTDRLNRGYHLSYYGDTEPVTETDATADDDGSSDAARTLATLFRRLERTEPRHRRLRRIELLTVRRFLETSREVPASVTDPVVVLERVREELRALPATEFQRDSISEVDTILELINRPSV